MSAAKSLLQLVWTKGQKDSWGRINHSMRNALSLAIGSGCSFVAKDFDYFSTNFRWHYWVTESTEWIYTEAIGYGNTSCVEAYEQWIGRKPFRANSVNLGWLHEGYIHVNSSARQRERLGVGFSFPYDNGKWYVTAFNDAKGTIRVARYKDHNQSGKPTKLKEFTHEEISELFPSKKPKAQAPESDALLQERTNPK